MHRSAAPLRRLALAALVLGLATTAAPARAGDGFSEIVSKYRAYRNRPSLFMRTRGRVRLAETHDPRAFRLLAADYGKAEDPADMVRSTIVTLLATQYVAPATMAPMYAEWRQREKDATDAWLWYRALRIETQLAGIAEAQAAVGGPLFDPFLRAAALKALVNLGRPEANGLAQELLDDPPKDPFARQLLSEAAVAALPSAVNGPLPAPAAALAEKGIALLEDPALPRRTKWVVARHLARCFGTDFLGFDAAAYRAELGAAKTRDASPRKPRDERYAPGRFFGLTTTGLRTVYVIDVSDSMLTPLSAGESSASAGSPPPASRKGAASPRPARPPPPTTCRGTSSTRGSTSRARCSSSRCARRSPP